MTNRPGGHQHRRTPAARRSSPARVPSKPGVWERLVVKSITPAARTVLKNSRRLVIRDRVSLPVTTPRQPRSSVSAPVACVRVTDGGHVMRITAVAIVATLFVASAAAAPQTPAAAKPATDIYHVHLVKAAPGQADALGKSLSQPDPAAAMPDHFVVLRHQEGDDWDYAVIQHLGQKATVAITPPAAAGPELRVSHTDTFVSGPSWADFTREMGIGGTGKPGAIYVMGFHRAVPGHRPQLEQLLNQPPAGDSKVMTGTVFLQHIEGSEWQYLGITRYNSWQDFGADQAATAAAGAAAPGGWADVRQHSASHRDTIA